MARSRSAIESRFRAGSNWFFLVGGLSALATTAFHKGWIIKPLMTMSLSLPMLVDQSLAMLPSRIPYKEAFQYYGSMFGWALAAVFLLIGVLSKYGSHTGAFLKLGGLFGSFARLGSFLGIAHLVGSRLFYFVGIVLYILDGALGFGLEALLRSFHISKFHTVTQWNLGFHACVLMLLLYGFLSGMERESRASGPPAEPPTT